MAMKGPWSLAHSPIDHLPFTELSSYLNPIQEEQFMKKFLSLLLALSLLFCLPFAAAEDALPGDIPRRGLILPMTQQDADMGLEAAPVVYPTQLVAQLPTLDLYFNDLPAQQAVFAAYTQEQLSDPALQPEIMTAYYEHVYLVGRVFLFEPELRDAWEEAGVTPAQLTGVETAEIMGENDGYVYVSMTYEGMNTAEDEALQQQLAAAETRAAQLLKEAQFQPIQFAEGELGSSLSAFPAFTTADLNGNTVTNALFAEKKLTVVNVWGTFCGPCIDEMDELAAWSQAMPENVQLVGLVSDLYSAEDAETLEMAKAICEATGADCYTHLIASADFAPLLSTVVGVPTTFFVDSTGAVVGEPIVGANVSGCMAFVEEYLNAQ